MAEANYYESPRWILQLAGCSANRVLKFVLYKSRVAKLGQLTGMDDKVLQSKALEASRESNFINYKVNQKATYLCPECLKKSSYARLLWDIEIVLVCHIHRCNLINKCPQCRQTIKWLRSSITRCKCGFDFRNLKVTDAADSQVNFALYRAGCLGNIECMERVKTVYGKDNPLFCLTYAQFRKLSYFLKSMIKICLKHGGDLVMSQDISNRFTAKSKSLSPEELVFDFFKNWASNVNYLFQWHHNYSIEQDSEKQTISRMAIDFVEFSSLLPINCFLSRQFEIALIKYLKDCNVVQIEIDYRYLDYYYEDKLDLKKIDNWLPKMCRMLDCPELTLSKLIWVCQYIKYLHWE